MACRLVHHIDGLVGKKPFGNIAMREFRRRDQRVVGDADTVMKLVFLFQAAQHENGVLDRRLVDEDRLEPAGQRRVLFHILPVFIQRRRADAAQLAPRQRRLQQVRGIHRAVGLAGADKLVHLVDEKDHLAVP